MEDQRYRFRKKNLNNDICGSAEVSKTKDFPGFRYVELSTDIGNGGFLNISILRPSGRHGWSLAHPLQGVSFSPFLHGRKAGIGQMPAKKRK